MLAHERDQRLGLLSSDRAVARARGSRTRYSLRARFDQPTLSTQCARAHERPHVREQRAAVAGAPRLGVAQQLFEREAVGETRPKSGEAVAPARSGYRRGFGTRAAHERIAHARNGIRRARPRSAPRRACRGSARRRSARGAARFRRMPAERRVARAPALTRMRRSRDLAHRRNDERQDVAASQRHAHDVADASSRAPASYVSGRSKRDERIAGSTSTTRTELSRVASASARSTARTLRPSRTRRRTRRRRSRAARRNAARRRALLLVAAHRREDRRPAPSDVCSGKPKSASSVSTRRCSASLKRPVRSASNPAARRPSATACAVRHPIVRRALDRVRKGVPEVEQFARARSRAGRRRRVIVLTLIARLDQHRPRPPRKADAARAPRARRRSSPPSMMAALTISARPSRSARFGQRLAARRSSQKTPTGSRKQPARFLPPRRSTPVLPPIAASTIATSDVATCAYGTPRMYVGARETEEVARDASADAHHERVPFDARGAASPSSTRSTVDRRLRCSPSAKASSGEPQPRRDDSLRDRAHVPVRVAEHDRRQRRACAQMPRSSRAHVCRRRRSDNRGRR